MKLFDWLFSKPVTNVTATVPPLIPIPPTPPLLHNEWPLQKDCVAFYGDPFDANWERQNLVAVPCPWELQICGTNQTQSYITIHRHCRDSVQRVLNHVWLNLWQDHTRVTALHYDRFSGSYNLRRMRGARSTRGLSMHAFGAAIDFDDAENEFHSTKHRFTNNDLLVQAFKSEGWLWGGDWDNKSVDAMHFQAARVR